MKKQDSPIDSLSDLPAEYARLIEELCAKATCVRWGLGREVFSRALQKSLAQRFRDSSATPSQVEGYLKSLHIEDLALACACAEGVEAAWEFFVEHFRKELRDGARAIQRTSGIDDPARAEELADSLYADLFGINSSNGRRSKSLFEYFHGRSKLSTWLRVVLAQRHIDQLRVARRTVSLEEEEDQILPSVPAGVAPEPVDPKSDLVLRRLREAFSSALTGMASRDRMILAFYYVDDRTLAQIGRVVGEHESTVSRQLDRIRRDLRSAVIKTLLEGIPAQEGRPAEPGLSPAQVDLALESALKEWSFDLSRALSTGKMAASPPE